MSQLSFLESVIHWDESQCQQNVDDALPKLISILEQCEDVQEQIGVTKVICASLLPWIQLEDAQSQVFSPLATKSSTLLDVILQDIEGLCHATSSQEQIRASLEMLVELLDCFVSCVKFVQEKAHNSVQLSDTASLLTAAVHILKGTYNHCKKSGDLYGDMLAGITELLSELFKKAHTLQVALLGVLEKVTIGDHVTNQDVDNLLQICMGLFQLCHIVTSLDTKLLCGLWKTLSRFSVRHREHLGDELNIDEMIAFLSSELRTAFMNVCQWAPKHTETDELVLSQGDTAAFQRALKVAGYQMKILTFMLDNFVACISTAVQEVISLIITIYRNLPPSLVAPSILPHHVEEIRRHISNGVEPIVNLLISQDLFIESVLGQQPGVPLNDALPYLLLLIKVCDRLPLQTGDVQEKWLISDGNGTIQKNLLESSFLYIEECYVEMHAQLVVPGNAGDGRPGDIVTLYEYICTHLCALIGCFPAEMLGFLEKSLFHRLFSPNSNMRTLATDLWCFMARYGTAELCCHQTELLIQVYTKLEAQAPGSARPVISLTSRLVKFLAPEHQTGLLKKFPPSSYPDLWMELPLTLFPAGSRSEVTEIVCRKVTESIQKFLKNSRKTYNDLLSLTNTLENVNSFLEDQDVPIPTALTSLVLMFQQLWSALTGHWHTDQYFKSLFAQMITLAGNLVSQLGEQDILQVLQEIPRQLETTRMKLVVSQFLLKISKLQFAPHSQLSEILGKIPHLYQSLLTDSHCIVQHQALDSFTQFAENTPYETLVPQCLNDNQNLQETVVAYLNNTPHHCPGFDEAQYLDKQKLAVQDLYNEKTDSSPDNHGDMLDQISEIEEPVTKRKRIDETECSPEISAVIADLKAVVKNLETIKAQQTVTSATKEELRSINNCLKNVIDSL